MRNSMGISGGIRLDEKGNLYVAAKGILVYEFRREAEVDLTDYGASIQLRSWRFPNLGTLFIPARTSVYAYNASNGQ